MLSLDSPDWTQLRHAYGSAEDIPALLRQLRNFPDESNPQSEPWFSLWSALCHQGDVYPASFAAVPHLVAALQSDPTRATFSYFLLPACIEIARSERRIEIPSALEAPYFDALKLMPNLAAQAVSAGASAELCASALAASAAASGHVPLAALLIDVEPGDIDAVREWVLNR
ncbi:hypothetical protein [Pseudoxanthomonas winnipegensis]|uniref:Uncharacterized protein n=1 Tax=Pseudoxanthomonas winnipegensis TaxID=2480810 RepID=A0A4Q8MA32_9GAMM|nr:hypothetical protein [Pseudoxanthomonas winnipegensis]TAA46564.1 hypothetical protein EA655_02480 [Pseudoxanthomonas winnipegensis]